MKPHEYSKTVGELIAATFRIVQDVKLIEGIDFKSLKKTYDKEGKRLPKSIIEEINIHNTLEGIKIYKPIYEFTLKEIVDQIVPKVVLEAKAENDPSSKSYCPATIDKVIEDFNEQYANQNDKGNYIWAAFTAINNGLKEKENSTRKRQPYYEGSNNPGYDKILEGVKALMEKGKFGDLPGAPVASYNPTTNPRVLYDIIKKLKKELDLYADNNAVLQGALKDGKYDEVLEKAKRGCLRPKNRKQVYHLDPEVIAKVIYSQATPCENGTSGRVPEEIRQPVTQPETQPEQEGVKVKEYNTIPVPRGTPSEKILKLVDPEKVKNFDRFIMS